MATNTLDRGAGICFDEAKAGIKKDLTNAKNSIKGGMAKIHTAPPANTRPALFQSEGACFCEPSPLTLTDSITYISVGFTKRGYNSGRGGLLETNIGEKSGTKRGIETNTETKTKDRERTK